MIRKSFAISASRAARARDRAAAGELADRDIVLVVGGMLAAGMVVMALFVNSVADGDPAFPAATPFGRYVAAITAALAN
jgi:hypothetical protein